MGDITQMDLYALFGVDETCSLKELTTAFRKKALTCHPDKFPGDEEKKEVFLLIKRALELLADKQARQAYDACQKQKKIQEERLSQMDASRKKFKETLEKNEQKAARTTTSASDRNNTEKLRAEVERLRREGNRLVIEELEKLHLIVEEDKRKTSSNAVHLIIKYLPDMPTYTDDELRSIFQKYGTITEIVNRSSKRALIEFDCDHISSYVENEKGLEGRPFASVKIQKRATPAAANNVASVPSPAAMASKRQTETIDLTGPNFEDFEAMILRKMSEHAAKP